MRDFNKQYSNSLQHDVSKGTSTGITRANCFESTRCLNNITNLIMYSNYTELIRSDLDVNMLNLQSTNNLVMLHLSY